MISLVQASCEHYERCQRREDHGFTLCAGCPNAPVLAKVHPPAAELGAGWALGEVGRSCVAIGGGLDASKSYYAQVVHRETAQGTQLLGRAVLAESDSEGGHVD